METIRELVDAGEGYTLFPLMAALQMISQGGMQRLRRFSDPEPHRDICMVHGLYYNKPALVSALSDAVRRVLPDDIVLS